jgi:tRNA A58 N-methylase Trm61
MLDLRKFINIKMNDTFTRRYQVLKNRTHPMMSMHGFGGYLLTAIKVDEAK